MEPTEEQRKEFWKWCGFVRLPEGRRDFHYEQTEKVMDWTHPNLTYPIKYLPRIRLDSLFEYAVSKVFDGVNRDSIEVSFLCPTNDCDFWVAQIKNRQITIGQAQGDTDALALFWAIWKIINP